MRIQGYPLIVVYGSDGTMEVSCGPDRTRMCYNYKKSGQPSLEQPIVFEISTPGALNPEGAMREIDLSHFYADEIIQLSEHKYRFENVRSKR